MKDFSPLAITSAAVGFPARLIVITRPDGTVYRIAESDTNLTVDGNIFQVVPGIQVSAVKHTANGEMPSCQIVAVYGSDSLINGVDLDVGLFDGAAVQIYIVDRLDLSRKGLHFTGSIANTAYSPREKQVVFDVKGPAVSAKKLMTLKRSPMCRTDLFSSLCQLDKTAYDVAATVATIVDAFNFTVSGLAQADAYFNQGVAVTSTGTPFEVANWVQSTQTITAYLPCSRIITVGMALTLYPGCDKTDGPNGCGKFSNWINMQAENHWLGTAAAAQQV